MRIEEIALSTKRVLDTKLFSLTGNDVTIASIMSVIVVLAVTWILSKVIQKSVANAVQKRDIASASSLSSLLRLLHYAIILGGFFASLQVLGIDLSALFTAGAVLAVGFGFALQNITQNFVSGIILIIERTIRAGDVLEVEGRVVKVQKVGIRSTIARTRDEEEIIIPNSVLVQGSVKNYTMTDASYRLRAEVGVIYGSDMKTVQETLYATADAIEWRSRSRDPVILLTQFGNSSVDFEVCVWIDDPWKARIRKSELNKAIWWALKEREITIAFPQLDVHFDKDIIDPVHKLLPRTARAGA